MIMRALDSSGDWQFGRGKNSYYTGKMALEYNLKTRLREWKTDCFFSPNSGVDYSNFLEIGTQGMLDQDIRRVTLQSEGILTIDEFESTLDRQTREYTVNMTLGTIYGTLNITEEDLQNA